MPVIIPSFLRPPDTAGAYGHGLQIGTQLAEAQARLEQEQARVQLEYQARQQQADEQAALRKEQLATQAAYHQSQLGLRQQRIEQLGALAAQHVQQAAARAADEQGFAADLASGKFTTEQALYRHPTLSTPAAVMAAHRDTADAAGKHLQLQQDQLALARERLDMQQRALEDRENKPGKVGTMDLPLPPMKQADGSAGSPFNAPTMRGVPLDSPLINQVMGTNAPAGTGTNYGRAPRVANPFASPEDVKAAYTSGKLSRDGAKKILNEQFGYGTTTNASGD